MNPFEEGITRYISRDKLKQLSIIKIGIAGAGGLGSNCAQMLVRTGFRNFKIIDFDVIDASNLNRQFYFLHQVGKSKVEACKENLLRINPNANIEAVQEKFESNMAGEFFADCHVVIEAFDRAEYKKIIVESYMDSGKLLVAASGLAGWGNSDNITVHKLKPNFYLVGDLTSAISPECPPLAPRVHVAAAKQADIVVKHFFCNAKAGEEGHAI